MMLMIREGKDSRTNRTEARINPPILRTFRFPPSLPSGLIPLTIRFSLHFSDWRYDTVTFTVMAYSQRREATPIRPLRHPAGHREEKNGEMFALLTGA